MADKKISALSNADPLDGSEYTVIVQNGVNVKVNLTKIIPEIPDYDPSVNLYPSTYIGAAILKGNEFFLTGPGTLGVNPVVRGLIAKAMADSPGQTDDNWKIY